MKAIGGRYSTHFVQQQLNDSFINMQVGFVTHRKYQHLLTVVTEEAWESDFTQIAKCTNREFIWKESISLAHFTFISS